MQRVGGAENERNADPVDIVFYGENNTLKSVKKAIIAEYTRSETRVVAATEPSLLNTLPFFRREGGGNIGFCNCIGFAFSLYTFYLLIGTRLCMVTDDSFPLPARVRFQYKQKGVRK